MNTPFVIEIIRLTRQHFIQLIETCTIEELNHIPQGYKNNLIWNFAHVVSSQQMLCYEQSGLTSRVDAALLDAYRPQTFPEPFVNEEKLEIMKNNAVTTVDWLRQDYEAGLFINYQPRQTRFGIAFTNIEGAIAYISTHETLHFGYAKALLKAVRGQ